MNDHELDGGGHPDGADGMPSDFGAVDPDVAAALGAMRSEFGADAPPPVGAALSEFVDVHLVVEKGDLPVTAASNAHGSALQTAGLPNRRDTFTTLRTRGNNMLETAGTFLGTLAGKIALGATVTLAAAGGVQAAGVDVPVLPGGHDDPVVEQVADDIDETTTTTVVAPAVEEEPEDAVDEPDGTDPDEQDGRTAAVLAPEPQVSTTVVAADDEDADDEADDQDEADECDADDADDEADEADDQADDQADDADDQDEADEADDETCEQRQLADAHEDESDDESDDRDHHESDDHDESDDDSRSGGVVHESDDHDDESDDHVESDDHDTSSVDDSDDADDHEESDDHDDSDDHEESDD